jgi:hypothetical protein
MRIVQTRSRRAYDLNFSIIHRESAVFFTATLQSPFTELLSGASKTFHIA